MTTSIFKGITYNVHAASTLSKGVLPVEYWIDRLMEAKSPEAEGKVMCELLHSPWDESRGYPNPPMARVVYGAHSYWRKVMRDGLGEACFGIVTGTSKTTLPQALQRLYQKFAAFERRIEGVKWAGGNKTKNAVLPSFYSAKKQASSSAHQLDMPMGSIDPSIVAEYGDAIYDNGGMLTAAEIGWTTGEYTNDETGEERQGREGMNVDKDIDGEYTGFDTPAELLEWIYQQEPVNGVTWEVFTAQCWLWNTKKMEWAKKLEDLSTGCWKALERTIESDKLSDEQKEQMRAKQAERLDILRGQGGWVHPMRILGAATWIKKTIGSQCHFDLGFLQILHEQVSRAVLRAERRELGEKFTRLDGAMHDPRQEFVGGFNPYESFDEGELELYGVGTGLPMLERGDFLNTKRHGELLEIMAGLDSVETYVRDAVEKDVALVDEVFADLVATTEWPSVPFIWMVDDLGNSSQVFDFAEAWAIWDQKAEERAAEFKAMTIQTGEDRIAAYIASRKAERTETIVTADAE